MKTGYLLLVLSVALSSLFTIGCATDREAQTRTIRGDTTLLSATNSLPGSTHDVRVYVIARGDTVAGIARKFGISIAEFMAINPDLKPTRLKIGQNVRIYEKQIERF
jgi:LysM repeat protein